MSFIRRHTTVITQQESHSICECYVDSGATAHMCNDRNLFDHIGKPTGKSSVFVGNGQETPMAGLGSVRTKIIVDRSAKVARLKDVLVVPKVIFNVLSVITMRKTVLKFLFDTYKSENGYCNI